ncbi:MAG: hypothetical protein IKU67_01465 [Firmicutes bacterium]|nr:hypothetical protein [Bacillota bacterium]
MSATLKRENCIIRDPLSQIVENAEKTLENERLIRLHYETDRVIVNLGIRFIGRVDNFSDIINIVPEAFGDAYNVGVAPPYDMYIWTREYPDATIEEGEWLNIGTLAIPGPVGPTPIMSNNGQYITATDPVTNETTNVLSLEVLKGTPGTRIKVVNSVYSFPSPIAGDIAIIGSSGEVFEYLVTNDWRLVGNIKGPQGNLGKTGPSPVISNNGQYLTATDPQTGITRNVISIEQITGPKGNTGDVGGFINIRGILANSSLLPEPITLNNLTYAYLVGTQEPYVLWIQVGENSETADWRDVGTFNVATLVTVNGEYQNIWSADTKIDKIPYDSTQGTRAYISGPNNRTTMPIDSFNTPDTLVQRDYSGNVLVDPKSAKENIPYNAAITWTFTDNEYIKKDKKQQNWLAGQTTLYATSYDSYGMPTQATAYVTQDPVSGRIPRWSGSATLRTENPINAKDCVNLQSAQNWINIPVTSSSLTSASGVSVSVSNFKLYYNPIQRLISFSARATVTNSNAWTVAPYFKIDDDIFAALGEIKTLSVDQDTKTPIEMFSYTGSGTSVVLTAEPEGAYIELKKKSDGTITCRVAAYETLTAHRTAGSKTFRLNACIPY